MSTLAAEIDNQEQFITTLKKRNEIQKTLENSIVSRQKSQSLKQLKHQNPKKSAEILLKNRMDDHLTLLQENINNLSKECDKFGGATFIQKQLDRNEMKQQQYVEYCVNRIRNNFELPEIKRSWSNRNIKQKENISQKKHKYNKWFIEPDQRFSKSKERTKYDWNKNNFMLNIVDKQKIVLDHQYLPLFINKCRKQSKREPLLCKYAIIRSDKHY